VNGRRCPEGTTGTPPDCQPIEEEPVLAPEPKEEPTPNKNPHPNDDDAASVISVESSSRVLAVK
jgi:hypothetical protein